MQNKVWLALAGVLVGVLVGGGAFYGGMTFERVRARNAQDAFFAARGIAPGGGFPAGGGFPRGFVAQDGSGGSEVRGGVVGTIKSVDGDALTVSTPQDVTTVVLTDETTISKLVEGSPDDLQPGWQITVRGERDSDGAVTAATIQVLGEAAP